MSITHLDSDCLLSDHAEGAAYSLFNPGCKPGRLVAVATLAARSSLGGQVASRLAIDHFIEGAAKGSAQHDGQGNTAGETVTKCGSEIILETAFKEANACVYDFSHKLAAGGKMAAALFGLVIEENTASAGRVGEWSAYLWREGLLFPFFEERKEVTDPALAVGVGANALVAVETASVPLSGEDIICATSTKIPPDRLVELGELLEMVHTSVLDGSDIGGSICQELFSALLGVNRKPAFELLVRTGPEGLFLGRNMSF